MGELANCARCNKVFVKITKSICPDCVKDDEKQFQIVYDFLKKRENRQATIPEIVEATGVKEDIILQFVKDNRLRSSQFPNLSYPCQRCGDPIASGKICENCTNKISSDLRYQQEVERVKQKNEQEQKQIEKTYYTRNRNN
ncbi:flagellar operon protein TIGR03826 [Gracilibacillus orientalis]|uniref:Flagellar operon protein TIGR03826 n=1 Tax=Gracilibacillus orientalis TaxID=334253 RepID=A0A1I4P914_9BACI|nr:TIGR03826 family flagellar region protein [Gracilibacillus orientalis]SFM23863.1 flagellar operon protein TIGR03826 [Gracilibacillus orientalis]